jgi:hypothetical protein
LKHVDGLKEPENDAMKRGKDVHKKAEKYASGELKKRPKELDLFAEEFKYLRRIRKRLELEERYATNAKWESTGFFSGDTWCRVVFDVIYAERNGDVIEIIDHKTGKVRPENDVQLDLDAAVAAACFPDAKIINCSFWYLDWGEEVRKTYTREEALALQKHFDKDTKKMLADRTFKPTPGNACRWCPFRQVAPAPLGGKCKY